MKAPLKDLQKLGVIKLLKTGDLALYVESQKLKDLIEKTDKEFLPSTTTFSKFRAVDDNGKKLSTMEEIEAYVKANIDDPNNIWNSEKV